MSWDKDSYEWEDVEFSTLLGKTLTKIEVVEDTDYENRIIFHTENETYILYHSQECCENVTLESIVGNVEDLIGHPILLAELSTNREDYDTNGVMDVSRTWSFYKLATIKGYVDIRWYGESNGYYSETVNFRKIA